MAERPAWGARRILETAFAAVVAIGLIWCARGFWHDRHLPARFERVHIGMDRKAAEAALGRPRWEGACAEYIDYLPRAGCSTELGYSSAFAPIRAHYYILQLDRSGKVIEAEPVRTR
jgi:hypothetical protein